MMNVSGYALRIAALLDAAEAGKRDAPPPDSQDEQGEISLRNVQVVTPTGVALVDDLSVSVSKGASLLVCGPSGIGKTSIFRVLKGMWPADGLTNCPADTMFLPQQPYIPAGSSLQDQLAYPRQLEPMPPQRLKHLLSEVSLLHLLEREEADWGSTLSLGEKQQLQLGRALLRKPAFCVLDESTSAVEVEVESAIYAKLRAAGITLISVSHRASLLQFHDRVLRIGPERSWSVKASEAVEEDDFPSPIRRLQRTDSAMQRQSAAEEHLRKRTEAAAAQPKAGRPLPQMSDVQRTLMLLRVAVPKVTLADESLVRLLVYCVLLGTETAIRTGFLRQVPGQLQALAIQSDVSGYVSFQFKVLGLRATSMVRPLLFAVLPARRDCVRGR